VGGVFCEGKRKRREVFDDRVSATSKPAFEKKEGKLFRLCQSGGKKGHSEKKKRRRRKDRVSLEKDSRDGGTVSL